MTAPTLHRLHRAEHAALILGGIALIATAILGWAEPHSIVPAWRLALFACLQPAIGSLVFILIHRTTGGAWGHGLAPFLLSGARLLPWIWLLVLPLLWFPMAAQPSEAPTAHEQVAPEPLNPISQTHDADQAIERVFQLGSRRMDPALRVYFSRPMLAARAGIYALFFFALALVAPRAMRATVTLRWYGPAGLIALVFFLHFLATDWFILLDPGWFSTGFPLVWIAAQAIAGIALAIAAASACGADTSRLGRSEHVRGLDWGNLMLASIMVWAYVAFVQLLIIWSGNLPSETAWYRHRAFGVWRGLAVAVAVIEFGAPFLLLLSRAMKKRPGGLAVITVLLLVGQIGYTVWLIAPAFPEASAQAPWLLVTMCIMALAVFTNRYLAGVRRAAAALTRP